MSASACTRSMSGIFVCSAPWVVERISERKVQASRCEVEMGIEPNNEGSGSVRFEMVLEWCSSSVYSVRFPSLVYGCVIPQRITIIKHLF